MGVRVRVRAFVHVHVHVLCMRTCACVHACVCVCVSCLTPVHADLDISPFSLLHTLTISHALNHSTSKLHPTNSNCQRRHTPLTQPTAHTLAPSQRTTDSKQLQMLLFALPFKQQSFVRDHSFCFLFFSCLFSYSVSPRATQAGLAPGADRHMGFVGERG